MEEKIIKLLGQPEYTALNAADLLVALALPPTHLPDLLRVLAAQERTGQIARIKGDRFVRPMDADLVPGRIRINRQGKGFLQCDDSSEREIMIPEHATATAFNGDRVLVRRDAVAGGKRGAPKEITGKVIRILERARTQLVGTLRRTEKFLYVIPDDPRIPHDIYVAPVGEAGTQPNPGDKVLVDLRAWESRHVNPEGEIVEVLGRPDAEGVDMLSVLRQYGLAMHFPQRVLDESEAIGTQVKPAELAGRTDCREHPVVTIDPDDAKDFDDAICLQPAPNQHWKLWVHIADVSHYVKPGTALDEEAKRRGNSTYLVDRVIPMLPEGLSNELCSLKPHVDRLTKCAEFLLTAEGKVVRTQFYPAVIHSQRRFTYKEALATLQHPPTTPIEQMLHEAHHLAQLVRRARFQAGSLEMDFPETKIRLDEKGRVLRIERNENDISHQLIEEFMLLANEAVATKLMAANRPAIYRIHEAPDERRLREYREDVLSHQLACGNLTIRNEVQKLLHKLGTVPIGQALKIGFLRSLMRARYAVEPLGHYGLAKKKYTHFTSPIRRYADLVVHRALFAEPNQHLGLVALKEIADHISTTERDSADAERDSKDLKMFAYLEAQLQAGQPQVYGALVTDVRNFGFFVDVTDLGMSGAVPLSTMTDDFYQFDGMRSRVVGRRTRRVIQLGDRVSVQIAKVDRFKKQVDFRMAVNPADPVKTARPAVPGRPERKPSMARANTPRPFPPRPAAPRPIHRKPVQPRPGGEAVPGTKRVPPILPAARPGAAPGGGRQPFNRKPFPARATPAAPQPPADQDWRPGSSPAGERKPVPAKPATRGPAGQGTKNPGASGQKPKDRRAVPGKSRRPDRTGPRPDQPKSDRSRPPGRKSFPVNSGPAVIPVSGSGGANPPARLPVSSQVPASRNPKPGGDERPGQEPLPSTLSSRPAIKSSIPTQRFSISGGSRRPGPRRRPDQNRR